MELFTQEKMILYIFLSILTMARGKTLPGSCSFQETTCDYTADAAFLSWNLNPNEHFITVDANSQGDGDKAVLLGPDVELQDWSCLRIIYQITGAGSLQVLARSDGESFDHTLWSASGPSDSWLISTIDLQNSTEPYKIVIEGGRGSAEGSSVSIFEVNISDKYCIECDFEESHLCGYVSQWSGNVNWYVGRGAPNNPALSDGPGHYMYVDSIHSRTLKEVATLLSAMTSVPMSGCLSFQYQQDHAEGHMFSVYSRDRVGQYRELWSADLRESNQVEKEAKTQVWIPVQVTLSAPYPLQVVFEVSFNSPKGGRVLLDDIAFSPESCSAETEPVFDPLVADCDFEVGFCLYTQNMMESEMWKRVSVQPNVYRLGDHTTGRGSFLLASSRFIMQSGSISRLFGPALPGNQKYCLKFFYSVRGFSSSEHTLAVYLYNRTAQKHVRVWTSSDRTRDVWIQVELSIQTQNNTQVMFTSTCKSFWNCGSAALDDISLRPGDCELPLGSPLSVPSHCDFENGLCGFMQEKERDIADWVLIRGPTPTSYTGPKGDHTTGVGHYLYIEASLMLPGHSARLLSRPLRGSRASQCLLFFYNMYGSGTGSLRVLLRSELEDGDMVLWKRSGEESVSWMKASVTYQYDHQHQIVFEAIRGPSILSDIAIDDIKFQKGPCKDAGQ
ncbi:MAM domain-containing protein 2 isoform X1 [Ictalurus furcatus]|uniref:MAM domain-containing protein 2 isoform X1 n=1 Tax=Ictalurus furcatus TaxID=66913 RepID=UPI00234FF68E|nr:MAM domain-containing protein 2 isoform X1 [Ictalurus furcatus]